MKERKGRRKMVALWILLLLLAGLIGAWWLMIRMPGESPGPDLPPAGPEVRTLADALREHVETLAGHFGGRGADHPERLAKAADHLEEQWREAGLTVSRQPFAANGHDWTNLEVTLQGRSRPQEVWVVGAHYDAWGGLPGADDNASGAAAALELAKSLKGARLGATVKVVLFANEEPPYYRTEHMGSVVHARRMMESTEQVMGMLSLEMLGFYRDDPGSQDYPTPFSWFYPDRGNFIAFVGNVSSRDLVRQCVASFRESSTFPSEGAALPSFIPGAGWSDHWAYWQEGVPAVMVTDTAFFRNPNYHEPTDRPETLDYERMARVVAGLERVILELAR